MIPDVLLRCDICGKYNDSVKFYHKVWFNESQDYIERYCCSSCLIKWGKSDMIPTPREVTE